MKKTKTILILLSTFALGALLSFSLPGGTLAYFTNKKNTTNTLTVGENKIQIVETFPEPPTPVVGTNTYTKTVNVKNTGDVDCYVRVFIDFSDDSVRNKSTVSSDGTNYYTVSEFVANHLPQNWVYVADGALGPYFYYTQPIAPNASTTNLLHSFKTTFAATDEIRDFDVYVYAESVQTRDNNGDLFTGTDTWRQAWTEFLN